MLKRISLALETGAAPMPASGRIAVFDPPAAPLLPGIDPARIEVVSASARLHADCARAGISAVEQPRGSYAAALVCLDRSRPAARLQIATAVAALPEGAPILVDGQKTDGVDPAMKDCRARVEISDSYVKSHGRLFWFAAAPVFGDWAALAADWPAVEGFRTAPGVFSADGVDPGSLLLARTLPVLKGAGADLGAGWGYLSAAVLKNDAVTRLHLVEEDGRALRAARANLDDPRARFHWADATAWQEPEGMEFVISNPPFHARRETSPDLGRAFIAAAARMLARHGRLWMVANRHLPYEAELAARFGSVREVVAQSGYKVIEAGLPKSVRDPRRRA
ncbi:class I SAM-dependent methyltransferase [Mangrovicoccus algicola]|uniref:Class I SAM-dependent methyltransferase n=1 Tax=Mangrovicoccus algicola TaxID=2771008 RepID=A0A8J6YQH4_9RHOB|nr:class I SAM-dependent methyltransferase [Mangrovicoccus algicola]MBE3637683.1 class I SAM-dependent methyltransferase [Mangrovicoccus algicola]